MIRALRSLVLGFSVGLAGCATLAVRPNLPVAPSAASPSSTAQPEQADRAIALVGTVGAMRLVMLGRDGGLRPLGGRGLPGDAAWLSGDGSRFVVTTLSGATALSAAGAASGIDWSPAPGDLGSPHPLRAFGSLQTGSSLTGTLDRHAGGVALAEGDPGSGAPGQLIVATLGGGVIVRQALRPAAESAPAWLPDGRIVVVVRDESDVPTAMIFDPVSGQIVAARAGPMLSVAIGGQTVTSLAEDGTVRVSSVGDWLRGETGDAVPGTGPDEPVIQAQPSLAGDEIVLVVADPAGDAASLRILASSGGWHEIARFGLPSGANRAVASWLVAPSSGAG